MNNICEELLTVLTLAHLRNMASSGAEQDDVHETPVGPINHAVTISVWSRTAVSTHLKLM